MENNHRKLMSNGAIYFASSMIAQLINLFLIPIYARNLTTVEYGQYNIVNSLQSLLSIGITLGIFSGMCRFFNEYEDKNKLKNIALTFSLLWGSICILVVIIVAPDLANLVFKGDVNGGKYIQYVVINSVLACVISIYNTYYAMKFKAIRSSGITILNMLLTWFLSVYLVANLKGGAVGILKSQCYAQIIVILMLFIIDIKNIRFSLEYEKLMSMLKYGAGLSLGQISAWVLTLMDRYFIKYMVNLSAVAIYSMAYKIGMLINPVFISPFQRVVTSYKYLAYKENDGKDKIKVMFNYYNFIGWFSVLGLSLFAKFGIKILATNEYVVGFKLVPLIAFSYFLWGMGGFYALGLQIANKMLLNSAVVTIAAVVNLIANFALIPSMGMYGAALATIISYIIANIMYFYYGRKYYNLEVSILDPYKYGIVFVVIYTVYYLVQSYLVIYLELVFNTLLCICYLYACIKLKFISYKSVKKLCLDFKQKLVTKSFGYVMNLDDAADYKNHEYKIVPLNLEKLNEMKEGYENEISSFRYSMLKDRLENNEYEKPFVVINWYEEICGYFHIAYKPIRCGVINGNVKLSSDTVYFFDDYTFKKHRGMGVHKFSISERIKIAKEEGYKKATVIIIANNIPSERAYANCGFIKNIRYTYFHILNFKKTFVKEVSCES